MLVLESFVGPRPKTFVARHLDGNRFNNHVKNLKWGTQKQNIQDKKLHGTQLCGNKINTSKLNEKQVKYIKNSNLSNTELSKKFSVGKHHIWQLKTGRRWKHLK